MLLEQQRKSIGQSARELRKSGYSPLVQDPLNQEYQDPYEALKVWNVDLKHERFVLVANLLDRSVSRVEEQQSSILTNILRKTTQSSMKPYEDLSLSLKDLLAGAINHEMEHIELLAMEGSEDRVVSMYRRFSEWTNFHNRYLLQTEEHQRCGSLASDEAITKGLDVALPWKGTTLKMIPRVAQREGLNLEMLQLIQAAHNSYAFLGKLASYDILTLNCIGYSVAELLDPNEEGEIDPAAFILRETKQGVRLDFSALTHKKIEQKLSEKRGDILNIPRIGCPALVNFGTKSPVAKIWGWYLSAAPNIYQREVATQI
jgi:hypothetical protein